MNMIAPGTDLIITATLGTMSHPEARGMEPEVAKKGGRATYFGPHPTLEDWHFILVCADGRPLFCPVMEMHFTTRTPESELNNQS